MKERGKERDGDNVNRNENCCHTYNLSRSFLPSNVIPFSKLLTPTYYTEAGQGREGGREGGNDWTHREARGWDLGAEREVREVREHQFGRLNGE